MSVSSSHAVLIGLLLTATGAVAQADVEALNPNALDLARIDRAVAPSPDGLELAFGGGYTQGVGGAGSSGSVEDLSGPGGGFEAQLGWRVSPRFTAGAYGTIARFRRGDLMADGDQAWGATAGVQAIAHTRLSRALSPWGSLGTGVRGLWLTAAQQPTTKAYGLELARVQLGLDIRISPSFALSPVLGASASVWLAEDTPATAALSSVHDNRLNLYVFTGVLGRFNARL